MESIFPWPPKQGVFLSKTGGRRPELEKTTPPPHGASQNLQGSFRFRRQVHVWLKASTGIDYVHLLKEDSSALIQLPNHLPVHFYSLFWF